MLVWTLLIDTCVLALCTHSPTDSSPAARTPASQPSRTAAAHVVWARSIIIPMTCAPPSGSSVPVDRAQHLLIFTLLFFFSLLRTLRHHRHLPLRAAAAGRRACSCSILLAAASLCPQSASWHAVLSWRSLSSQFLASLSPNHQRILFYQNNCYEVVSFPSAARLDRASGTLKRPTEILRIGD